jgi:predicted NAD-dependent protein-ADP-ribosyltransferase YbiA (DUF1768 family)
MESYIRFSCFNGYKAALSNTRYSYFDLDGLRYNSVEQFFQNQKAEYLKEDSLAADIMGAHPVACRRLGNTLEDHPLLKKEDWPRKASEIMLKGLYGKV